MKMSNFLAMFLAFGFLVGAESAATAGQASCPFDVTGPGLQLDGQVTLGVPSIWWEGDVYACYMVREDGGSYPQYASYFPGCDIDGDGRITFNEDVLPIYYNMGPCPVCASPITGTLVDCDDAVANDYCDLDSNWPVVGYLRDGVWDGQQCLTCVDAELNCGDGLDGDCDGMVDCADPDCVINGSCTYSEWDNTCGDWRTGLDYGAYEANCGDGLDDDADGHTDCFDRDCVYGGLCPTLDDNNCVCPDLDGDGVIFEDWDDLRLAAGTIDYEKVYTCTQTYEPFCTDTETRSFLAWMGDKGYEGRITALYADDARDPFKRTTGGTTFQRYFDLRNDIPGAYMGTPPDPTSELYEKFERGLTFKHDPNFAIQFIEVVATDADIVNDINTEEEVMNHLKPYFEDRLGRSIDMTYEQISLDYAASFGPHGPCTVGSPNNACFDFDAMAAWATPLSAGTANVIMQFSAKELVDGTKISIFRVCQTCSSPPSKVWHEAYLPSYLHEYLHNLSIPHPLAQQSGTIENLSTLIGTGTVMTHGYVGGSTEMLGPLERYALEPTALGGYEDETTFASDYSADALQCRL